MIKQIFFWRKIIWLPINHLPKNTVERKNCHDSRHVDEDLWHIKFQPAYANCPRLRICSICRFSNAYMNWQRHKNQQKAFPTKHFIEINNAFAIRGRKLQFFCVRAKTHVKFEDTLCLFKAITRSKFGHVCDENYRSYRILVQIIT